MDKLIVFDDHKRSDFLPLAFTKPLGAMRVGTDDLAARWSRALGHLTVKLVSVDYLSDDSVESDMALHVNARNIPNKDLVEQILLLKSGQTLVNGKTCVAFYGDHSEFSQAYDASTGIVNFQNWNSIDVDCELLETVTDLFSKCAALISWDFKKLTKKSAPLPDWVTLIGSTENLYIDQEAELLPCTINTQTGPVIILAGAVVMEQCALRGPLVIGEGTQTKMACKVYGPSSFGPHCRIGGEVSNSVLLGFSNKGHDGFLGNSVIGEWCNLGADTNTSNLKNNYGKVKRWSYTTGSMLSSELTFSGLIMGDHSKCGINTMFNTGTTVGVGSSVFNSGFPPNFIPDFTWGQGNETYDIDKMIGTAKQVMARRKVDLSAVEEQKLRHIFSITSQYRTL